MGNKSRQDSDQNASNDLVETSASNIPVSEFKSMKISNSGDDLQDDSKSHSSTAVLSSIQESSSTQKYVPPHLRNASTANSSNERPYVPPTLKNKFVNSSFDDSSSDKPDSASFVKSELVGKFIALPTTEMSMEQFEWRHLDEGNMRNDVLLDLNEGFDSSIDYSKFWYSSIKQLFEFIMEKATDGTGLKEAVHGCEFVANRGTLAYFASRGSPIFKQREENEEPPKLHSLFILTKFEGIIFINRIYDIVNESEDKTERVNQKFYWLHKLTNKCLKEDISFDKFGSSYDMHFGVFKAQVTDLKDRSANFFISAKVDGQDKDGKFVEINLQSCRWTPKKSRDKPEPNWYLNFKSKWYFQASLANVERIIVGMHEGDEIVKKVRELCMFDMGNEKKQWEPDECTKVLLDTFKKAQELLDTKPEQSLLKLETFSNQKEPAMTWIEDDDRKQYEFLPPEFVERFSFKK